VQWRWDGGMELSLVNAEPAEIHGAERAILDLARANHKHARRTAKRLEEALRQGLLPEQTLKSLSRWCDSEPT
jgi:hypothetical protein